MVDLFGLTHHNRRGDFIYCWENGDTNRIVGDVVETIHHDTLYAHLPVTQVPECVACDPMMQDRKDGNGGSRTMQAAPCLPTILPYNEYAGQKGYFGRLSHALDTTSPIKSATRIDSITFETMITSVSSGCVQIEVAVDSIFTQTFVLGCGELPGGTSRIKDGTAGRSMQGLSSVVGGYKLLVNLSSLAPQLASRPSGSMMTIELRMKTVGGSMAFVNGTNAHDLRPRLHVYGQYQKVWDRADYTIAYKHDDKNLVTTLTDKIDDARHTSNALFSQGIDIRRTKAQTFFGADYRLLKSERTVIEPSGTRIDSSLYTYTGLGAKVRSTDPEGDTVVTRYDALDRPVEMINADGKNSTISYLHGTPDSLGVGDQEFFGYCEATITTNENGVRFARFTDAFGRLRREIAEYSPFGPNMTTTKYEYDLLGRLVQVVNPKGDTTRYTHDAFGRVKTKFHPDLGTIRYIYDDLGNVRFVQDARQAEGSLLTFNQYDDLNRLVLVGEAYISETFGCGRYNEDDFGPFACSGGSGFLDTLNGNILHIVNYPSSVTVNPSLFKTNTDGAPAFASMGSFQMKGCLLDPEPRLGETVAPSVPFIMHPTRMYQVLGGGIYPAWWGEFEDVESFPDFARIGISYDRMPNSSGAIWERFPLLNIWDRLVPGGKVRNQRGREAAVAYRDRAAEPYHYSVMSYDERGRVEALLRHNENLGFDAVYYQYNSANQVIALTVIDPLRRFTTWYGYDQQGRVDTVWTKLDGPGSGLLLGGDFENLRFPGFSSRAGLAPDIVYSYTKMDQVRTLEYPTIATLVEYAYNRRKFLDSMVATRGGTAVFSQRLEYDLVGQITKQHYEHGSSGAKTQHYSYDPLQRLTDWAISGNTTGYMYDAIGNRNSVIRNTAPVELYGYHSGTNRLSVRVQPDWLGGDTVHAYSYNANGAQTVHTKQYNTGGGSQLLREELFGYSFRGLNNRSQVRNGGGRWQDWRYRYNAMGEREQKRLYAQDGGVVPAPDSTVYPWVYYLLGGSKQQLAVYHGQQMDSLQIKCGDVGMNRVYLYPWEYISYGVGTSGLVITRPVGGKEYKVVDHLGSTRSIVHQSGSVIGTYDNEPFGSPLAVTGVGTRAQYIDKERDQETSTSNHGVRQYDAETGRFVSVDPLWEKYSMLTPYQYAANNPVNITDTDGKDIIVLNDENGASGLGHAAVIIGNDEKGWIYYSKDGLNKETGEQEYTRFEYKSLGEFLSDKKRSSRYQHGAWIVTDEEKDAKAQKLADKEYSTKYNAVLNNCADLVDKTLKSVGIRAYPGGTMINIPKGQFILLVTQGIADKVIHIGHKSEDDPVYFPKLPEKKKE